MTIFFLNAVIRAIGAVITWVLTLLPDSPFTAPSSPPDSINLGYITWLLDFPTWIAHFTLIVTSISVYYGIRVILRWIKVAKG